MGGGAGGGGGGGRLSYEEEKGCMGWDVDALWWRFFGSMMSLQGVGVLVFAKNGVQYPIATTFVSGGMGMWVSPALCVFLVASVVYERQTETDRDRWRNGEGEGEKGEGDGLRIPSWPARGDDWLSSSPQWGGGCSISCLIHVYYFCCTVFGIGVLCAVYGVCCVLCALYYIRYVVCGVMYVEVS